MKDGPEFAINYMTFHGMIGDPKFYDRAPAFFFMKEQGLAIHQKIVDAILNNEAGCRGCSNVQRAVEPLFRVFAAHVFKLAQDSPEALDPVTEYIAEKKGYRPVPLVLYYKHQKIVHRVEF